MADRRSPSSVGAVDATTRGSAAGREAGRGEGRAGGARGRDAAREAEREAGSGEEGATGEEAGTGEEGGCGEEAGTGEEAGNRERRKEVRAVAEERTGDEEEGGQARAGQAARGALGVSRPWPAGSATGVGSMPGTDPAEAIRVVLGELPDLPFLPELPARGPHADLTGRGTALLADLHADLQPSGWRVTTRPARDGQRARDLLARDLDALEETGAQPELFKVQAPGPWTLAAMVELTRGDRLLADPVAVTDLAQSLAEGLRAHLEDVSRRLSGATVLLQLDEPALPAVLAAQIPTASGYGRLRAPGAETAADVLRTVLEVAEVTVVHCCAPRPPIDLLRRAGAGALSLDAAVLTPRDDDAIGLAIEEGAGLLLGLLPGVDADLSDVAARMEPAKVLWRRLGFEPDRLPGTVVVTPSCGLAGSSPSYARSALRTCAEMARRMGEQPE
ncbi:MAG: hypothetical protein JWP11_185 [Frankiales bacterium]|nr:hypothetical protein [Frankiales bacterium]